MTSNDEGRGFPEIGRFRVVGINDDGKRSVIAEGLFPERAWHLREMLVCSGAFRYADIEREEHIPADCPASS